MMFLQTSIVKDDIFLKWFKTKVINVFILPLLCYFSLLFYGHDADNERRFKTKKMTVKLF